MNAVAVRERPILFSAPMIKAILDGRKSQTRRIIKLQPPEEYSHLSVGLYHPTKINKDGEQYPGEEIFGAWTEDGEWGWKFPYGQAGSKLWVRETWATYGRENRFKPSILPHDTHIEYLVGHEFPHQFKWRPSIFMPRWASRITLEITDVRVQQIKSITREDIRAEGVGLPVSPRFSPSGVYNESELHQEFADLWDRLNSKRGRPWASSPWVWAISFKVLKP